MISDHNDADFEEKVKQVSIQLIFFKPRKYQNERVLNVIDAYIE